MKKQIDISGMSCNNCVKHVTEALEELEGVKNVKVSLKDKNAIIEVDNVADENLTNAIEEVGYEVTGIKSI